MPSCMQVRIAGKRKLRAWELCRSATSGLACCTSFFLVALHSVVERTERENNVV